MNSKQIKEFTYIVFDVETTGLDPKKEQIIELAARKINHEGETLDVFHRFIKLYDDNELSDFIINLTNITPELLQDQGEDVATVMDEYLTFINDSILVAQNAVFDMGFLSAYYLPNTNIPFTRLCIDTINIAKFLKPNETSYKLSELVSMFDVEYDADAHHRADYDVLITTNVLIEQFKQLNVRGVTTLEELLLCNYHRPCSDKQESFLKSLMSKKDQDLHPYDVFTVKSASYHIDYYLNK